MALTNLQNIASTSYRTVRNSLCHRMILTALIERQSHKLLTHLQVTSLATRLKIIPSCMHLISLLVAVPAILRRADLHSAVAVLGKYQ